MKAQRSWFILLLVFALMLVTTACSTTGDSTKSKDGGGSSSGPVTLKFMFWGSAFEKQAVDKMVKAFESSHPNIKIDAQQVTGDYNTKINTLMATNELPDVAYLGEPLALKWGEEGKVLDMSPYLKAYPQLGNRIPQTYYYFAPGKTVGTNTAAEIITMYYNKDLFKEAGVQLPPSKASEAWTWDQFVETAKKLTKDKNGKTPLDAGFDPKNIVQYGVSVPTWSAGWYPFLLSNGADITNEDGTKYTMNSPEAVEVFQKLQDLMYKHFVAPTATQQQNMPATNVRLQTKKVAMAIDGQWSLLDFASTKMNFGMGVLPKFKTAKTMLLGAPTVIFANTKHQKEAMEFYLYHNDPEQVDLYAKGLWMPLEMKYYDQQEYIDKWTKNDVHPTEFKDAIIDYTLKNAEGSPSYSLKNFAEIDPKITAGLDKIWTNSAPAKQVLDDLQKTIEPLLKGKYSRK
ncbi:sugar ABC transporter substrate-binding protein [Paenibacillus sp. GP183]|uniref:ABC transporter substrate-binding protein n=1 Tax=Paenibacillus sp. GP183 TaxID=1882751 RepID=UPI00089C41AF|nr:sugar ABC transporter substrate-binding protein [Paenibacillus sp. GP183]SEC75191.1 carbohydrate ABC transporter substrate-binding protein, CUT1 family [Paenibacillus sp. GP183]